jgi:hypothetical protein
MRIFVGSSTLSVGVDYVLKRVLVIAIENGLLLIIGLFHHSYSGPRVEGAASGGSTLACLLWFGLKPGHRWKAQPER